MNIREKITQGAWLYDPQFSPTSVYASDKQGNKIAECTGAFTYIPDEQRKGNALAVSKVPEMLELIEIMASANDWSDIEPFLDQAKQLWEELNKEQ